MARLRNPAWAVTFCLLALAPRAAAQNIYASLTGTVSDQKGGLIPGASITAQNVGTGMSRSTATDAHGNYLLPQLPAGTYDLEVEYKGFKKDIRTGIVLQVGQTAREDFQLLVGEVSQTVQVTASAPVVDSETASVGQVVNNTQIIELPLNGRNFNQLPMLAGGVVPAKNIGFSGSGFSVGGNSPTSNSYTVDGIDFVDPGEDVPALTPSLELLQEFRVEENSYSADTGSQGGGHINLTTKSGTNAFHGSLFEFFRNSALDAKNFFEGPGPIAPLNRNQFGGSLGGPVRKNKTFFFFVFEGQRFTQSETGVTTVPTKAMENGDFSELLDTSDPFTIAINKTLRNPTPVPIQLTNPFTRAPIPGDNLNNVPGLISPVGRAIAALYPTATAGISNYTISTSATVNYDQYSLRLDHSFSSQTSVFGRYTLVDNFASDPFARPGNQTVFPGYAQVTNSRDQNAVLGYTQLLGGDRVNNLRLGYTRLAYDIGVQNSLINNSVQLGIGGLDPLAANQAYSGTPAVSVSGFGGLGYPAPIPQQRWDNTYEIVDDFTWNRGSHLLKFGTNLTRYQLNQGLNGGLKGSFSFTGQFTIAPTAGFGFADLLAGVPQTSGHEIFAAPLPTQGQTISSYGFYLQDNWSALQDLTLDLGLRYELDLPNTYHGKIAAGFNPELGVLQVPSGISSAYDPRRIVYPAPLPVPVETVGGGSLCDLNTKDFAPRIGLAYRPFHNGKTVVRASYGIFYNLDPFNATCGSGTALWSFSETYGFNPTITPVPLTLADPFPSAALLQKSALSFPGNIPRAHRLPYTQQWALGVERQIGASMVLEVRYVGLKGTHIMIPLNLNQASPCTTPGNFPSCLATEHAREPFNSLGIAGTVNTPLYVGNSDYNSMVVRLQKRMSNGLNFLATYTWSHAIDDTSGSGAAGSDEPQIAYDLAANRGNSLFDIRQRFVASATYQLPFGKDRPRGSHWGPVADAVLGGWQWSGIFTKQTGDHLTPLYAIPPFFAVDNSLTNGGNDRPNWNGQAINSSHPTIQKWFNTAAFTPAPPGIFGNAPRGAAVGPGVTALDMSIQKNFRIRERSRLEVRIEMFNALNHPIFADPTTAFFLPTFGQVSSTNSNDPSREFQFGFRYSF